MPSSITVVVPARSLSRVRGLLVDLDRQDLAPDRFSVAVVPLDLEPGDLQTLDELARNRPNVVVLPRSTQDDWYAAASDVADDHVLLLDERDHVLPTALSRLTAALGTGDVLLAPVASSTAAPRVRQLFRGDALDRDLLSALAGGLPAVVERHLLGDGKGDVAALRRLSVSRATSPVALTGAPAYRLASVEDDGLVELPSSAATADKGEIVWDDGTLVLQTTVTLAEELVAEPVDVHLWLRNLDDHAEHLLPTEMTTSGDTRTVRARLDADTAADGGRLPSGRWCVVVQVESSLGLRRRRLGVGKSASAGLVTDRVVAVSRDKRRLVIDVGGAHTAALPVDADAATIVEDARGTSLRLPLPFTSVRMASDLPARVRLGTFPLEARVVPDDGRAVLTCFLSGLAGREAFALSIAGSRWWTTATDLTIANAGTMTLDPHVAEPETTTPAAQRTGHVARPASDRSRAVIRRLRARLRS